MLHETYAKKSILANVAYDQRTLLTNLEDYLEIRNEKNEDRSVKHSLALPFGNTAGVCSGMVAYWLFMRRIGEEGKFIALLYYVATWDKKKFQRSTEKSDPKLETFMNNVFFLHNDQQLRGIASHHFHESLALLTDQEEVAREFNMAFVFSKDVMADFITEYIRPNKMLRFGNALHTVGAYYENGIYYFDDADDRSGLKETKNVKQLVNWIFGGLGKHCKSKDYIALDISVFDLQGSPQPTYPNVAEFRHRLLQNKKYKTAVLHHPNILRVGMLYDLDMLNMLFDNGFKFVPSDYYDLPELASAIAEKNLEKIAYLVDHQVPVDYKGKKGTSALGIAIQNNSDEMLYLLLSNYEANPNAPTYKNQTPLEWALFWRNTNAIILLIAFGAEISDKFLHDLDEQLPKRSVLHIKHQAELLNAKLLHLPGDDQHSVKYLQHLKLKIRLGLSANPYVLHGRTAIQISNTIDQMVKQILAVPSQQRAESEWAQIAAIVQQLEELRSVGHCSNPNKLYVARKATKAIQKIEEYFPVQDRPLLVFSQIHKEEVADLSFETDIARYLSKKVER